MMIGVWVVVKPLGIFFVIGFSYRARSFLAKPFLYSLMKLTIDSPANPRIKELVKLRESPRRRRECGAFFVEGGDELLCLARAGKTVHEIYFSTNNLDQFEDEEVWKELEKMEIDTIRISKTAFSKASIVLKMRNDRVVSSWNLGLANE